MMKHKLTLGACLLALTLPTHAQILGQSALPIDITPPMTRITESLARDIRKQQQVVMPEQVTGADALLDAIPDANDIATDLVSIVVLDKNKKPILSEIHVQHGWRALKQEWLLLLEADQLPSLRALPITVISETHLPHLKMLTVRISVNDHNDNLPDLTELITPLGIEILERHHVYDVQAGNPVQTAPADGVNMIAGPKQVSVGVIDTAFDQQHLGLSGKDIHAKSFVEANMAEPIAHGTAVIGRLIGKSESLVPLLPKAKVFAASVFYQKDAYSQSAPTIALLEALEWLLAKRVSVINMSLAGPPNALLEKALQRVREHGVAVVAASGNAGPASRPLFPAAYDSVIAVSAVNQKQQIYRWANRGKHIDFVALGVNVNTLRAGGGEGAESGTSMATPVISAVLAQRMTTQSLDESLAKLRKETKDLGKPGRDVIFGHGFVDRPN